jgi:hypothetical protein
MAVAVARSAVGNQEAVIRALPGKHGALAKPTSKRRRNIEVTAQVPGSQPTKPCSRVSVDQMNSARVYTGLVPKRSNSQPPGICPIT